MRAEQQVNHDAQRVVRMGPGIAEQYAAEAKGLRARGHVQQAALYEERAAEWVRRVERAKQSL